MTETDRQTETETNGMTFIPQFKTEVLFLWEKTAKECGWNGTMGVVM